MKTGMEKTERNIKATRLETWAMPGVPDVVLLDEFGNFHFVELKATAGNAVDLKMEGLKVEPYYHVAGKIDWTKVFTLICPTTSHIIS